MASKQFLRSFSESPDSNTLRQVVSDLNTRYQQLKTDCLDHATLLDRLMEKHKRYWGQVDTTQDWLEGAGDQLNRLLRESIGGEKETIRHQIEQLNAFRKDVGGHQKDVDGVRDAGSDLASAQPNIRPTVDRTSGESR